MSVESGPAQGLEISVLFPTLLGVARLPRPAALNRELAACVRSRERSERDQSPFTTVNNGWQSGLDFLDDGAPATRALRRFFDRQIEAYLAEWGRVSFGPAAPRRFRYSYTGWAVILREGGFQHEHVHTKTDLVGVYYVETPERPRGASAGGLTLTDPRAGRLASRSVWEASLFSVEPEAGTLLLFPSFVPHRVERVSARGERISINFDVTLQGVS